MKSKLHKNIMMLMLLAFVSQVVAAPLSTCNMSSSTGSVIQMEMDSGHDMPMMNDSINAQMDCCGDECKCPQGVCLTTLLFVTDNLMKVAHFLHEFEFSVNQFNPSNLPNSVFHPPILS